MARCNNKHSETVLEELTLANLSGALVRAPETHHVFQQCHQRGANASCTPTRQPVVTPAQGVNMLSTPVIDEEGLSRVLSKAGKLFLDKDNNDLNHLYEELPD